MPRPAAVVPLPVGAAVRVAVRVLRPGAAQVALVTRAGHFEAAALRPAAVVLPPVGAAVRVAVRVLRPAAVLVAPATHAGRSEAAALQPANGAVAARAAQAHPAVPTAARRGWGALPGEVAVLRPADVPAALLRRAGRHGVTKPRSVAVVLVPVGVVVRAVARVLRLVSALPPGADVLHVEDVPVALVMRAGRLGVAAPGLVAVVLVPVGVVVRAAVRVLRLGMAALVLVGLGMSALPPGVALLRAEDVPLALVKRACQLAEAALRSVAAVLMAVRRVSGVLLRRVCVSRLVAAPVALVMRACRLGVAEPRPGAVVPVPGGGVVRAEVRAFRPVAVAPMAVRRVWAVLPRWVCVLRLEAVPVVPAMRARRLRSAVSRPGVVLLVPGGALVRPGVGLALRRVLVLRLGGVPVALVLRAGRLGSVASWTGSRCLGAGLSLALVAARRPGRHGLRPGTGVPRLWERLVRPAAPL